MTSDTRTTHSNKKLYNICLILTLIPVIATAIMIFCFSAQTGEESSKTSGKVVEKVVKLVEPKLEKLTESEQIEFIESLQYLVRKTGHFLEYTLFGFFLLLHIRVYGKKHAVWWAWGFGTVYAITDEFHQLFIGSRSGRFTDVLLDSAGVFAGILLMQILWTRFFSKIYNQKIYRECLQSKKHEKNQK